MAACLVVAPAACLAAAGVCHVVPMWTTLEAGGTVPGLLVFSLVCCSVIPSFFALLALLFRLEAAWVTVSQVVWLWQWVKSGYLTPQWYKET